MTEEQLAECGPPVAVARLRHLGRLEYRRISCPPPDNWVGIMYRRSGDSFPQLGVGVFKDGEWRGGNGQPLGAGEWLWLEIVGD